MAPMMRRAFIDLMDSIRAKESLRFIQDVGAVFDTGDGGKEYVVKLAMIAFSDDETTRARIIEAVTRKRTSHGH